MPAAEIPSPPSPCWLTPNPCRDRQTRAVTSQPGSTSTPMPACRLTPRRSTGISAGPRTRSAGTGRPPPWPLAYSPGQSACRWRSSALSISRPVNLTRASTSAIAPSTGAPRRVWRPLRLGCAIAERKRRIARGAWVLIPRRIQIRRHNGLQACRGGSGTGTKERLRGSAGIRAGDCHGSPGLG
jgi:hypothetical protein